MSGVENHREFDAMGCRSRAIKNHGIGALQHPNCSNVISGHIQVSFFRVTTELTSRSFEQLKGLEGFTVITVGSNAKNHER